MRNENPAYPGCPECKKKMVNDENGWRCEKCSKQYPEPTWRYVLTASIEDATAQLFVQLFDDQATTIVGISANEAMRLKDTDADAFSKAMSEGLFKTYNFKIRAQSETFNVSLYVINIYEYKRENSRQTLTTTYIHLGYYTYQI